MHWYSVFVGYTVPNGRGVQTIPCCTEKGYDVAGDSLLLVAAIVIQTRANRTKEAYNHTQYLKCRDILKAQEG